jgi:hypothetical protein
MLSLAFLMPIAVAVLLSVAYWARCLAIRCQDPRECLITLKRILRRTRIPRRAQAPSANLCAMGGEREAENNDLAAR